MKNMVIVLALLAIAPSDAFLNRAITRLILPSQLSTLISEKSKLLGSDPIIPEAPEVSTEKPATDKPSKPETVDESSSSGSSNGGDSSIRPVFDTSGSDSSSGGDSSVRPIFQSLMIPYYYVPVSTYSVGGTDNNQYNYYYPYANTNTYSYAEPRYLYI